MKRRETQLMENETLLSLIYFDPKYIMLLTDEHRIRARQCLCNLAVEMDGIENETANPQVIQNIELMEQMDSQSSSSSNDAETFEQHLRRMQKGRNKAKK